MRLLIALAFIALLPVPTVFAEEVFGSWMIFPGPNPTASDLLPEADPDTVFRIGQIIFEYPFSRVSKIAHPVDDLSDLQPVAEIVKVATADPALDALIQQQLPVPHSLHFEKASVIDYGDAGLVWHVTHSLYPKQGGFSGVPFRYRAVVDGRGNIIPPQVTVFDAYFHSAKEGWSCSLLQLPATPRPNDPPLTDAVIRKRATARLENVMKRPANSDTDALPPQLQYKGQKLVRIPSGTDPRGALVYHDIWAINFVDPARKERPGEVFTIWVTTDGSVAELRRLDLYSNADEQNDAPELPAGRNVKSTS